MTRTDSPSAPNNSSGTASPTTDASGYLLLTIQNAVVNQVYAGEEAVLARGELRLECISLPIPSEIGRQTANPFSPSPSDPAVPTHDFWLVLRVGPTFEMPLIPTQKAESSRSTTGVAYTIDSQAIPEAKLSLVLPLPASSADLEDLDSFEVLLRQYGSLPGDSTALKDLAAPHLAGGPSTGVSVPGGTAGAGGEDKDMRGKLVLVNEDNGEVVGELDHDLDLEEDHSVSKDDKDKPVVLDFGNVIDGYMPVVKVRTVPEDEMDDWILKGAHYLSKGILSAGSWSSKTIQSSADMIIRNTKQYETPVQLPSVAKAGVRMTHNASARTVKVTKRTMGMVNDAVQNVVETTYKKGVEPAVDLYRAANEGRRQSIEALFGYEEKPALPSPSPQPQTSEKAQLTSGLPLPPRKPSPLQSDAIGMKIDVPSKTDTLLAQEQARDDTEADAAESDAPPAYSDIPISQSVPIAPKPAIAGVAPDRQAASTPPKKRPFLNRLLLAGEVVLTSLEATAQDLINSGTGAASSVAGHKLGPEAGRATALLGGSVRNVAVVYIDVRGVGRRALLKGTAKGFVKARLASGEEVKLQGDGEKVGGIEVEEGQVERVGEGIVVGMTEVQKVEQPAESEPTQSAGAVGPDEKAALAKV